LPSNGNIAGRLDDNRHIEFNPAEDRHSGFGYVAVSRASQEATIFTDDVTRLAQQLGTEVSKTSALEIDQTPSSSPKIEIGMEV